MKRLLDAIFFACGGSALPLEVVREVGATAAQGADVVDDVAGARAGVQAGRWAGVLGAEGRDRRGRPLDAAALVAGEVAALVVERSAWWCVGVGERCARQQGREKQPGDEATGAACRRHRVTRGPVLRRSCSRRCRRREVAEVLRLSIRSSGTQPPRAGSTRRTSGRGAGVRRPRVLASRRPRLHCCVHMQNVTTDGNNAAISRGIELPHHLR